ncbi:crocetin glucosyltransferase 3 [Daucus carota subsp. sativus]|nr:PREDICTED: crocetin glucosyltransferase 3-like [Daucus carota subsp. sativus]
MESMGNSQEHIVMIPFLAQGHIIPFMELAKKIQETTDFTITLVNTPLNIQKLKSAQSSSCKIHFASLPFNPLDHNLPPNTETTEALPLTHVIALFHASTSLQLPFQELISELTSKHGKPPLCIISDVFMGWTNQVAKLLHITNVSFSTCGAYGSAGYISVWQNLPHRSLESDDQEFVMPGFPDRCKITRAHLHKYVRNADGNDDWSKFFQPQISLSLGSFGWLCNTVEEIEPLGLKVLENYTKLPIWCIGPLLPPRMLDSSSSNEIFGKRAGKEPGLSPETCLQWLDSYAENSVLYISFGSQNTISPAQMMELATGVEESGKPFIWTIRPPIGFNLNEKFRDEWLPHKFEERMSASKRGLLVHKWAPQLDILCHKSTGAFLTHCGWNSTLESLSQGVPLIGWPLAAEQVYNSKMIEEEMGVGVELTRGLESCIRKNDVKRVIETVMENEGIRKKANEISKMIKKGARPINGKKGSSLRAMDDFVSTLLSISRV